MKKQVVTAQKLGAEIREELARWAYLKENGGSDPLWEDGYNMNLVRNHIIYAKIQCEELFGPDGLPDEYYLATPPETDDKYMARTEQIRKNAVKTLALFESSPDYVYLLEKVNLLTQRQCAETYIVLVINHVSRLKAAIDDNDLVCMRRYENADYWLKDFSECLNKVEKILSVEPEYPQGQLSLFDVFPSGLH